MNNKKLIITITLYFSVISSGYAALPKQGEIPQYTSNYSHVNRTINNFKIDDVTDADLRIVLLARVDKSTEQTFDLISTQIHKWNEDIPRVEWEHNHSDTIGHFAKGSVRKCQLDDDLVVENIVYWEQGKVLAYSMDQKRSTMEMPFTDHLGIFIVESDGNGGSLLTWRQYYNKTFSVMALMVTMGMEMRMESALENLVKLYGGKIIETEF